MQHYPWLINRIARLGTHRPAKHLHHKLPARAPFLHNRRPSVTIRCLCRCCRSFDNRRRRWVHAVWLVLSYCPFGDTILLLEWSCVLCAKWTAMASWTEEYQAHDHEPLYELRWCKLCFWRRLSGDRLLTGVRFRDISTWIFHQRDGITQGSSGRKSTIGSVGGEKKNYLARKGDGCTLSEWLQASFFRFTR